MLFERDLSMLPNCLDVWMSGVVQTITAYSPTHSVSAVTNTESTVVTVHRLSVE